MDWARMLAYVTGTVDQELLSRNEYLIAENRIVKAQLNGRLKLSDAERSTPGEIGHRLGRTALAEVGTVAKPDTILAWYSKLVAHKFDGSKARRGPGRSRVTRGVEQRIVRLAEENRDWGYDRIAGALANLGYRVCDQKQCPAAPRSATGPGAQVHDHLVGIHSHPLGAAGGHRLLHRGGARSARAHDLLRAIFHPSREPPGGYRRDHHPSQRAMDEANCTKRDHGRMRRIEVRTRGPRG
jgi:hypothetical protein